MAAENNKVRSFRIDDETAEKFREMSAKIGANQQETLAKLIEVYELQAGKEFLQGRKDEINQFERLVGALTRMYMASLEENVNMELTIGKQFEAQLQSKDTSILSLQEKAAAAEHEKKIAQDTAKVLEEDHSNSLKTIETLRAMLQDKESLNKELQQNIADLRARLVKAEEQAQKNDALQKDLDLSRSINRELRKEKEVLDNKLVELQQSYEETVATLKEQGAKALEQAELQSQLAIEREKLALEKQFQEELTRIREEKHKEIEEYQKRISQILRTRQEQGELLEK